MKTGRLFLLWLAFALTIVVTPPSAARADVGHALLIGISDYSTGYAQIPEEKRCFEQLDCSEDVAQIKDAIQTRFQFTDADIVTLTTPEQTTKQAILQALQNLVNATKPGDIVYIHYSGHGDQVLDPTHNGGLDSAIVPSDYQTPPPNAKTDQTANEISGATILSYIHLLHDPPHQAAQIVLSFDCCHSASAARGLPPVAKKRGAGFDDYVTWYKSAHPDYTSTFVPTTQFAGQRAPLGNDAGNGVRLLSRGADIGSAWNGLEGAGYFVFAACQNDDCAYECTDPTTGNQMGRLSYILAQVLTQATPETTYQQVFDQVDAMFHATWDDGQCPQLDGDPNKTLFGGNAVAPPSSIPALPTPGGDMELQVGSLQNVTIGSIYALYPKNGPQNAHTLIGQAQVTQVHVITADLAPNDAGTTLPRNEEMGAVQVKHNYATPPLSLDAASVHREVPDQAAAILSQLTGMVTTTSLHPDLKLVRLPAPGSITGATDLCLVRTDTNRAIVQIDPTQDIGSEIAKAVQQEATYQYVCHLGNTQASLNPAAKIAIRVVPVTVTKDANGMDVIQSLGVPLNTSQTLPLGSKFVIQISNTGPNPLYATVLDITSDGQVGVVWPGKYRDGRAWPQDASKIPAGTQKAALWVATDSDKPMIYTAKTSDSDEILKVIATDQYVDLDALATTRGAAGPFASILGPAMGYPTRAIGTDSNADEDPDSWTADTFVFQIH